LQATHLGQHLATTGIAMTHIFASPLTRATRTAQLIHDAQAPTTDKLAFTQVPALVEQDFGSLEGASWAKPPQLPVDSEFIPVESKESVAARSDLFLDQHLLPILHQDHTSFPSTVAVVSHGITISILWQRLLKRFAKGNVAYAPELGIDRPLEYFGGWSNTGYLELEIQTAPPISEGLSSDVSMGQAPLASTDSTATSGPGSTDGANVVDTAPVL